MKNNIYRNQLILSFLSIIFLNACGSSSSSDSSDDSSNDGSTVYTFNLTSTLSNQCGVKQPFTEIELLVQDEDWKITERYSADTNGMISFTTTDENINYTLVAKTQNTDELEGLDIISFYQAETTTPSLYSATYDTAIDNTTCECITNDVILTHRTLTTRTEEYSSLPYSSAEATNLTTTLFNDVEVCREIDQDWPIASFMVTGENTTQDAIGAANFLNSFTDDSNNWDLAAIEIPEETTFSKADADFIASQVFDNDEHFNIHVNEDDESMLIFNSHIYISEAFYKLSTEQVIYESSTLFSESIYSSHQQIVSTSSDNTYDSNLITDIANIDYVNFSELDGDGNFDYSDVDEHPMSIIKFTYNIANNTGEYYPVTWTNYHGKSGLLASSVPLTNYDDFVNDNATVIEKTEVFLLRSLNTSNYQDYISYFQEDSNVNFTEKKDGDFNENIHFYHLSHILN